GTARPRAGRAASGRARQLGSCATERPPAVRVAAVRRFPRVPLPRAITGHLAGRRPPLGVVVLALLLAAAAACAEDEPPPPPPGAPPGSAGQPLRSEERRVGKEF